MRWVEKVPLLRDATPIQRGFGEAAVAVGVFSVSLWLALRQLAPLPSGELLRSMSQIGATLLIAYAVEMSWLVKVSGARSARREQWLGGVVGLGLSGLSGIVVSLGLAERASVDHWIWLDELIFSWAVGSLVLLGVLVVFLPYLAYAWTRGLLRDGSEDPG